MQNWRLQRGRQSDEGYGGVLMRTIVAGSRDGVTQEDVDHAIENCGWSPSIIISGTARGADTMGEDYAARHNIPVERFPANWKEYGRSAGAIRNKEMAKNAEALIAVWNGHSSGTDHMIRTAEIDGLKVYIYNVRTKDEEPNNSEL